MTSVSQLSRKNLGRSPEVEDEACSGQSSTSDCPYCNGPETD